MKRKTPPKKTSKRKPLALPVFNVQNPEIAEKVELAFKCGGVEYYRFIDDSQMPAGRYKYVYEALKEADMRMNLSTLVQFVDEIERVLNGGKNGKVVELGILHRLTINMRSRLALAFEPASIERLSAVMYFDKTEDLKTYDRKHGAEKIDNWKRHDYIGFFLTKPIVELLGLKGISEISLRGYLETANQVIRDLTSDMQTLSEANI